MPLCITLSSPLWLSSQLALHGGIYIKIRFSDTVPHKKQISDTGPKVYWDMLIGVVHVMSTHSQLELQRTDPIEFLQYVIHFMHDRLFVSLDFSESSASETRRDKVTDLAYILHEKLKSSSPGRPKPFPRNDVSSARLGNPPSKSLHQMRFLNFSQRLSSHF